MILLLLFVSGGTLVVVVDQILIGRTHIDNSILISIDLRIFGRQHLLAHILKLLIFLLIGLLGIDEIAILEGFVFGEDGVGDECGRLVVCLILRKCANAVLGVAGNMRFLANNFLRKCVFVV